MSQVVYFSHSWKHEDTPLNLAVWSRLAPKCRLLIDRPPLTENALHQPYYISRIEALLRRSDLFACCLPSLPREKWKETTHDDRGDHRFGRLSPYILFEIRLAERAGIPRLVVYDIESGFRPPALIPSHSLYLPLRFAEQRAAIESGDEVYSIDHPIDGWLATVQQFRHPAVERGGLIAGTLCSEGTPSRDLAQPVREALFGAGIDEVVPVSAGVTNDASLSERLRSLDLLVADIECSEAETFYSSAHAHFVPTIRLFRNGGPQTAQDLPFILRGHPAGYQEDMLPAFPDDDVLEKIRERAAATIRSGDTIVDFASGKRLIQQRAYRPHLVFLSHAAKQDDRMADEYRRELIDSILRACDERGIAVWEYDRRNIAGKNWKLDMEEALRTMTHFVPLITDNYLKRDNCRHELDSVVRRCEAGEAVTILPFLVGARTEVCIQIPGAAVTQKRLPSPEAFAENAGKVVRTILESIVRS